MGLRSFLSNIARKVLQPDATDAKIEEYKRTGQAQAEAARAAEFENIADEELNGRNRQTSENTRAGKRNMAKNPVTSLTREAATERAASTQPTQSVASAGAEAAGTGTAGLLPQAAELHTVTTPTNIKEAFEAFKNGHAPDFQDGAFGASYSAKRSGLKYKFNDALEGGLEGGEKLTNIKSLATQSETLTEVLDTFKEAGVSEKEMDRLLKSNTREMQRKATGLGRDFNKAIKGHHEAMAKLAKGHAKLTKEYVKSVLQSEFKAAAGNPEALAQLEQRVSDFTEHMRNGLMERIDFHKDSVDAIKTFVEEMGEKGVTIKLESAAATDLAKAGSEAAQTAEQAASHTPPTPKKASFGAWAELIGGGVILANFLPATIRKMTGSQETGDSVGFVDVTGTTIGGLMTVDGARRVLGRGATAALNAVEHGAARM